MIRNAAITVLAAAVAVIIVVGLLTYFHQDPEPTTAGVPVLPLNAVTHGLWSLIGCQERGGDGACRLVRRVINNEAQRVVLSFVVTRGLTGNALFVVGLPPSVVIPSGVTLTPTDGTAARGAILRCRPQICNAVVVLNDPLIEELSAVQMARLEFVTANGRNVDVNIPINGFREGYAVWQMASPAPPASEGEGEAPAATDAPSPAPPG